MANKVIQEECGIVAIFNKKETSNLPLALVAAGGVQHRGQQGAGLALYTNSAIKTYKECGLLKDVFTKNIILKYNKPALWTLIHTRYGTSGGYNLKNLQPIVKKTVEGKRFAVAHNGEFIVDSGLDEDTICSDTYLFAKRLASVTEKDFDKKVKNSIESSSGAFSLIIGVDNVLYLARDKFGIRPLVFGEFKGGWIAASETHALDKIGAKILREVKNGEIIRISKQGLKIIATGSSSKSHFCDFEWAYFSRPDSKYPIDQNSNPDDWLSLNTFRERCGEALALRYPIQDATFVVGIPDSGICVGNGYANKSRIPYRQVIIRDHYDVDGEQRLFMRDDEIKKIDKKVIGKLSIISDKYIWKNAIVVVADDSIVRGNVSKKLTGAIFAQGAKEVHWVVGFPPVVYTCHLGVSIRTNGELIASRYNGDSRKIAKEIGATSVNYINPREFIKARVKHNNFTHTKNIKEVFLANSGCGGCTTGVYPIDKKGLNIYLLDPGGRGHALAKEILKSDKVKSLWTSICAAERNYAGCKVKLYRYDSKNPSKQALKIAKKEKIDLVVVGPEKPLSDGLVDKLEEIGVPAFGPIQELTWLETDKAKAKQFMSRWNIPVGNYKVFLKYKEAKEYINTKSTPLVVKASGLAAGKGSIVCSSKKEALRALRSIMIDRVFGKAGNKVVIEDRLYGIEQSVTAITDGNSVILAPTARDYKQRFDGNKGFNTGGMGSHSPSGNENIFSEEKVIKRIIKPALEGIKRETGKLYKGVLYPGLMWVKESGEWNPYVLEFNIRFGDPEAQVILPRLESPNWVDIFLAVVNGNLSDIKCTWSDKQYLTVCAVSGEVPRKEAKGKGRYPGYPGRYKTRRIITGLNSFNKSDGYVLHAGTTRSNEEYVTTGGRVLSIVSSGKNARRNVYKILEQINFDYIDYRKDIGSPKLLKFERSSLGYSKGIKLAILISGSGSTMENIINACHNGDLSQVETVGVISSNNNAAGIKKAEKLGIKTRIVDPRKYSNQKDFSDALLKILSKWKPDLISQNGWLPLTPTSVIGQYRGKIINQHPAPLDPEHKNGAHYDFGGRGMYGIVPHAAIYYFRKLVLENRPKWYAKRHIPTEAVVHFVTEKYDDGDVIKRTPMDIYENDTPEIIQQRLLPIEHETVISAIKDFAANRVSIKKRPKPFVRPGEEKFLYKAKQKAIEKYLN
jgi:phosphoribosylamine--glycine ligase